MVAQVNAVMPAVIDYEDDEDDLVVEDEEEAGLAETLEALDLIDGFESDIEDLDD